MKGTLSIFRREFGSYFATPVAYVFILVFLMLAGFFTFQLGSFWDRSEADLRPFFNFLPWLYLFLIPAISMRLWAEERKSGTIELLMTLPITMNQAVLGKFFAAWAFASLCLALTFPLWITVSYLGDPDHGVILASYVGGILMGGGFLAIGSCISAITKNQVIAFVISVVVCLIFILFGVSPVLSMFSSWAPEVVVDTLASFSFLTHFESITKGVVDARDILFFGSLIAFFMFANALILDHKKAV